MRVRDRGAVVTGIDACAGMLEQARRRLGDDADLADPLLFPDGAFDDVVASLVLHYLQDCGPTLAELRRVLAPGGRLIASVEHPFAEALDQSRAGCQGSTGLDVGCPRGAPGRSRSRSR